PRHLRAAATRTTINDWNGIFTHAFSQSSSKPHGKNGLARRDTINGLSLFLADRAGQGVEAATVPLLRAYPATGMPLLPFVEHGKRFTSVEWDRYGAVERTASTI
ncbi:MAG: hypothetical protein WCE63_06915, partial [Acidobacteriaceae bacterium]